VYNNGSDSVFRIHCQPLSLSEQKVCVVIVGL
jgi:hypothetical protein